MSSSRNRSSDGLLLPIHDSRSGGGGPYYQHSAVLVDDNEQQQEGSTRTSTNNISSSNNNKNDASFTTAAAGGWSLTDFGKLNGEYSRDGSVHVTDEVFNAASHLVATCLSILGAALLISQAAALSSDKKNYVWKIVSFSIYSAALIFLFSCSTVHHAVSGSRNLEAFWRMMDYLAIYPLIGGTFTPLCLVFYHDTVIGWAFCGSVWGIAVLGMMATASCFAKIPKWLSMTMYVTLGWLGACMTYWLLQSIGVGGFALFLTGGVVYTAGGYVYTVERPNPIPERFGFHEIWHVAVILGALCHWLLMYFYVLPAEV